MNTRQLYYELTIYNSHCRLCEELYDQAQMSKWIQQDKTRIKLPFEESDFKCNAFLLLWISEVEQGFYQLIIAKWRIENKDSTLLTDEIEKYKKKHLHDYQQLLASWCKKNRQLKRLWKELHFIRIIRNQIAHQDGEFVDDPQKIRPYSM